MTADVETRAKLLSDVLANPDDDGPRLVFADWLTQNGDVRGELIVTQIQLEHATGAARMKLVNRSSDLLYRQGTWLSEIKEVVRGVETKRGFVYAINAKASVFAKSCGAWFEREPIEELRVIKPSARDLATLRRTKHLAKLRALVFLDPVGLRSGAEVEALGELLASAKLRSLDLRISVDAVEELRALLAKLVLPSLEVLKLRVRSPSPVADALAKAKLSGLKQLAVPKPAVEPLSIAFPKATVSAIASA